MDIPNSPQAARANSAGGSGADSREEVPVAEIQRDVTSPMVPNQRCTPEAQQTTHSNTTRLRKGVGTKRKAGGLQKGRASKRPYVEEGDDFLLNKISLAAQNFGHPEFTWRGEPLSPPSFADETQERSKSSPEHPPASGVHTCGEETAEELGAVSPDTQAENSASRSKDGSCDEEPGQCTPLDPGTDVPRDRPLGETSISSTSEAGLSNALGTFDFLGVRLLGDPLEALASVLPDRLFEDIGKTTPFKFAQDIIESQITVPFLCFLLIIILFSFGHFSSLSSLQDSLRSIAAWSNFLEHMRTNPDIETILPPKISQLEHIIVSQDEVIAGLTQELSNLKERYKVLETRARVPKAFPGRVPNLSSETGGEGVLPDAERMRLSTESVSARQEVEHLSRELSSLRDEKLTLIADLNSAVLAKEALVIEKARLVT
jgi:hypothetical protein